MKKLIFILPLLYYSCTDDIVADIDALQTENAEQDAQIDSLLTVLTEQQEYIDSLNTVQNNLNVEQQAYIDSLISESSISDSLLQVYTDSLNTVQNAYIDSLHNAQQTTLTALANSALNAGFVETEVYSGVPPTTTWTDLDLSDVVGTKRSLVLVKYTGTVTITIRPNGETQNWVDGWSSNVNSTSMISTDGDGNLGYGLILTGNDGIIEWKSTSDWCSTTTCTATLSVVFYLNQ